MISLSICDNVELNTSTAHSGKRYHICAVFITYDRISKRKIANMQHVLLHLYMFVNMLQHSAMNLLEKRLNEENHKDIPADVLIYMLTQAGKAKQQAKIAYVENFKYGNGAILLVRNSGGKDDAPAMAKTMEDINEEVVRCLRCLVNLPGVSMDIVENIEYEKFKLPITIPKGSATSSSLKGSEVAADKPFLTIMLGNLVSASKISKTYLPYFNGDRTTEVDGVQKAKCVLLIDEIDLQYMTTKRTSSTEKSMHKKFNVTAQELEDEERALNDVRDMVQCLKNITLMDAFYRRYFITATVYAMVCRQIYEDAAKVLVVRPDISDYYTGYDDDSEHPTLNRRIQRMLLDAPPVSGRKPTKKAFTVAGDDGRKVFNAVAHELALSAWQVSKGAFKKIQLQSKVVLDHMSADTKQRNLLLRTDGSTNCNNQATIAAGIKAGLIAKAPQQLFMVATWNNNGCDVGFATDDSDVKAAWSAAFKREADAQSLKTVSARKGCDYSTTASIRDVLSMSMKIVKHTVCSEIGCKQLATMCDDYCPPTLCSAHSNEEMSEFRHINWVYVSGLMASRAAVMKSFEHECPLIDLLLDTVSMTMEDINQAAGRLTTITEQPIELRLWASKGTHELHKTSLLIQAEIVGLIETTGSLDVAALIEQAPVDEKSALNIAYLDRNKQVPLTRRKMMIEPERITAVRDGKALAKDLSPTDIRSAAVARLVEAVLDEQITVPATDDADDDSDADSDIDVNMISERHEFADAMEAIILSMDCAIIRLDDLAKLLKRLHANDQQLSKYKLNLLLLSCCC
jgi:hypothetical protein